MGQAPASGTNSLRTFPRNFKGRSGTSDDEVYLSSPETAAASALNGYITDPRDLGEAPQVELPEQFSFSHRWFQHPAETPQELEVQRGPNVKPFPELDALPDELELPVALKVGDNISTDTIMPAGNRVLPYRSNIPAISSYVYDMHDSEFPTRAQDLGQSAIIGGENYGQGSSREHAALAPRYLGVRAKVAKSFARIHKSNLINFGIIPLVFTDAADYEYIEQGATLRLSGMRALIADGVEDIPVLVETSAGTRRIGTRLELSQRLRNILLSGGALNHAKNEASA